MLGTSKIDASPAAAFALAWRCLRPDLFPRTPDEAQAAAVKMRMALESLNFGMMAMPLSVCLMALLYGIWFPLTYTLSWAAVCVVVWFPCWLGTRRIAEGPSAETASGILDIFLRVSTFVLAFGWQIALFWIPGDPYNNLAVTVNMVGATVAAVMTAAWLPLSLVQLFFYLGLVMIVGFWSGGVSQYIAGMGFVFGPFMLGVVATLHAHLSRLLFLESHKDKLIAELQASNRAKSDFLANMSHELRTPLNAILGFSEVIKDEVMGPNHQPLYKSYAGDIHASGSHLLGLINDILDLSKIEAGKFELKEQEFDLHDIAQIAVRMIALRITEKEIALTVDIPKGLTIWGDPHAFKQIALNIASNAVKFTPKSGSIDCWLVRDTEYLTVHVRDTGCGIRSEDLERVFESFGQGRHDVTLAEKGTGLGLPIVRGLIRAHGGDATLISEAGQGTEVRIHIPMSRVRALPDLSRAAA